jgi:hypothetical protein
MPDTTLDRDIAAYEAALPTLLADAGKFVVFFDGKNQGVFATYHEALTKGYSVAGDKPFLAQQISPLPAVQHFSRALDFECLTSR